MTRHLLVTNDFPPKHGGIQSYLWELWRRLPPETTTVLTTAFEGAAAWDEAQPFRIERVDGRILWPTPRLVRRIDAVAAGAGAEIVVLDPALPLGLVGARLRLPYGVILHGAEVTVARRLPGLSIALRHVLRGASIVVAAGGYPAAEGERAAKRRLPVVNVPPGVDLARFRPLDAAERAHARVALGLPENGRLVVGVSRLVPRKGFEVLVRAAARLARDRPDVVVAIAGEGRDRCRLERLARASGAPVSLLGPVGDDDLPALYGAADVFAMLCRDRWWGAEQEGFGIVFLEAAAAGVVQVAGRSGGSAEAVVDGATGLIVRRPDDTAGVIDALVRLLDDESLRTRMGQAARQRVEDHFTYDDLACRLGQALESWSRARAR
ncbi:glycosyltransferase family 4 protein [soil metagenome]